MSRRNLWDKTPPWVKATAGAVLGLMPPAYSLGPRFRKHLRFVEAAQWWSKDQSREFQLHRIREICSWAYERSSLYRETFDGIGLHPNDLTTPEDLQALPTIDRDTLRDRGQDMLAQPIDTRGVDFITTGGSSGEPLRFYIGSDRSAIEYAYLTSGWKRIGYTLGTPLAVIRGRLIEPDQNGLLHEYDPLLRHHHYSNFHMTDDNVRRYLEHIATIGPCFLHVYPSAVTALCKVIRRTSIPRSATIRGIIAESEIVYPSERDLAEDTFRCRYWSGYGHTEKLVAAAECEHSHDYHVWPTYGYFELLDEVGHAVTRPGGYGEITGTGFINRAMPFIRYRTGDWATYVADRCDACGRAHSIIRDIEGHKTQGALLAADGSSITIAALNMHDDTYDNVRRYQFRQDRPGHATLRVVPTNAFRDADRERIASTMQRRLSGRVTVDVEICDHIPLTSRGKAVYVDQRILSVASERKPPPSP